MEQSWAWSWDGDWAAVAGGSDQLVTRTSASQQDDERGLMASTSCAAAEHGPGRRGCWGGTPWLVCSSRSLWQHDNALQQLCLQGAIGRCHGFQPAAASCPAVLRRPGCTRPPPPSARHRCKRRYNNNTGSRLPELITKLAALPRCQALMLQNSKRCIVQFTGAAPLTALGSMPRPR